MAGGLTSPGKARYRLFMAFDGGRTLTDKAYLTQVQYRTDVNLAARQAVYAYQRPRLDLVGSVLDLAGLTGAETIADIGCGNGIYLAELVRRGHAGRLLAADLSPGMLAAARAGAPRAAVVNADAAALPLADDVTDVTLAPHMLYHVPDRLAAAREFRRVTRPGGQLLVVLNGADHLAELWELIAGTAAAVGLPDAEDGAEHQTYMMMTLDPGAELLSQVFGSVRRHDFTAQLMLPSAQLVADYVASMRSTQVMPDPAGFVAAVAARVPFGPDGTFAVRTHSGLLVCS
jgi:SAM-dependent methyltransferase